MGKSVFKELFGEHDVEEKKDKKQKKVKKKKVVKTKDIDKAYKVFLAFCITLLVFCITFGLTILTSERKHDEKKVLGETSKVELNAFEVENALDRFVKKFMQSYYKVDDSGEFGYIYNETENGIISLDEGLDYTYFEKGKIVLFDFNQYASVFWDNHNRKFIFWQEQNKYFLVSPDSDYYYKRYVGQHILQSFINDYLKNKDFITPIDENTWSWEWSFFTPINQEVKYSMEAIVFINPETEYLEQIKLLDEKKQVCTFEFTYEELDSLDFTDLFDGYRKINEDEVVSIL